MTNQEKQYIQGFNNGYLLEKFEPTLLATVLKDLSPTTPYLEGLIEGKDQLELEHSQKELDDLHRLRDDTLSRDNDLEKDV